jgi:osmotically-inducible protein OsmY
LSGKAGNAAEKDLVSKLVNDVKGVKSVHRGVQIDSGSLPAGVRCASRQWT